MRRHCWNRKAETETFFDTAESMFRNEQPKDSVRLPDTFPRNRMQNRKGWKVLPERSLPPPEHTGR